LGINGLLPVTSYERLKELLEKGDLAELKQSDTHAQACLEQLRIQLALGQQIQRLLLFPLTVGQRVLGLIDLGEFLPPEQSQFTPESIELAASIATQSLVLIDKLRQHEITQRHELLLASLLQASEHMLTAKALPTLSREIVRLAVQLVGYDCGGLCVNRAELHELEMQEVFQLPDALKQRTLSHSEGLIGKTARGGQIEAQQAFSAWAEGEEWLKPFALQTVIGVPLRRPSGEIEAVLFVAARNTRSVTEADLDVLRRFAAQAVLTLQISRSSSYERRTNNQLETLHRISNYMLTLNDREKLLHAVLTGITARYGLRLNRAVVLLTDPEGKTLRGACGVGQLSFAEARSAWERDEIQGLTDFASYRQRVQREGLPLTALHQAIRQFSLPLRPEAEDCFNEACRTQRHVHLTPDDFSKLPPAFYDLLQPESELVIVPLVVQAQVIGFIASDNKFSRSPITQEDLNLLATFANAAALALDHTRLLRETSTANDQLLSLHRLSQELLVETNIERLPDLVGRKVLQAAGAESVSLLLIDEATGKVANPVVVPNPHTFRAEWIRPNGFSMLVMHTGKTLLFPDVDAERTRMNSHLDSSVRAALCLPLSLPDRRLGVLWLHYNQTRHFNTLEIGALMIYANYAALALENARRLERMEQFRAASDALAGFADGLEIEAHVARQARELLHADATILWVYDQERDDFNSARAAADGISPARLEEYRKERPSRPSAVWRIMNEGSLAIPDASDLFQGPHLDQLTTRILRDQEARGFRGLALRDGDEQLGVLYVLYSQPLNPSEEEQKLALTFANHAALVLKKGRLLAQTQRIKKAAKEAARASLQRDRQGTLKALAIQIKEATDCDAVSLFEYKPATDKLLHPPTLEGVRNLAAATDDKEKSDHHLVYRMLNEKQPYVVRDVAADALFRNNRFSREEGIQSLVIFPLRAEGQKVGVLFVNYRRRHMGDEEELQTLQLFADQAAMVLYKQQLYEDRERELRIKQALGGMSAALLGATDSQQVLEIAARHTAAVLNTAYCHLVLRDDAGRFWLRAAVGWCEDQVGKLEIPAGRGSLTGYMIEKARPVFINELAEKQKFNVLDFVAEHGMHSAVIAPLREDDSIIGKDRILLLAIAQSQEVKAAVASLGELEIATEQQALRMGRWRDYRLALIDASQVDDPKQLLAEIRQAAPDLIVIVLLATPSWRAARDLFHAGASDCLPKSLDVVALRAALKEWLQKFPSRQSDQLEEQVTMREKVLLADNDPDFLNTRREILERAGYQIVTAQAPAQARALLKTQPFDAAILDNRLRDDSPEDRSGMELARTLDHGLPVILLTGYPDFRDTREMLSQRTNTGYLDKREGAQAMLDELERLLKRRVFIVHGRDDALREKVARFIERLQLQAVVLVEQPASGLTIIEKFERYSNVGYVVVLLTPDDAGGLRKLPMETPDLKPRARQNVIFELGYFAGKLGRQKVCVLYQDEVELPSDYYGVEYLLAQADNGWQLVLARALRQAGLEVDLNRAV
jgi:GAF domain-containing protein/DNA-binding response OmpR family regulator